MVPAPKPLLYYSLCILVFKFVERRCFMKISEMCWIVIGTLCLISGLAIATNKASKESCWCASEKCNGKKNCVCGEPDCCCSSACKEN